MTRLGISLCWQLCIYKHNTTHLIEVSSSLIFVSTQLLMPLVPKDYFCKIKYQLEISSVSLDGQLTQIYTPINNKLLRERNMHTYKHNYFFCYQAVDDVWSTNTTRSLSRPG